MISADRLLKTPLWHPVRLLCFLAACSGTISHAGGQTSSPQAVLIPQLGITEEIAGMPSVSPDGRLVATIDRGFQVVVWDVSSGRQLRRLEPASSGVREFSGGLVVAPGRKMFSSRGRALFSPDGRYLAATESGGATIWDVMSGRKVAEIRLESALEPQDIAFSPDGKRLAIPGLLGDCSVWDVETGRKLNAFASGFFERVSGKNANPTAVVWSPDGRLLGVAGLRKSNESGKYVSDHWVRVFDTTSGTEMATLGHEAIPLPVLPGKIKYPPDFHTALAFSPAGDLLAVGGKGKIWLRRTSDWKELPGIEFQDSVGSLSFSSDGKTLIASGNGTRGLYHIDIASRAIDKKLEYEIDANILGFGLSRDGQRIVVAGRRAISVTEPDTSRNLWHNNVSSISSLRASRNARRLVVQNDIATFSVWDVEGGLLSVINTSLLDLPPDIKYPSSSLILISDQGDRLVTSTYTSAGKQGGQNVSTLAIWDATTGKRLRTIDRIVNVAYPTHESADWFLAAQETGALSMLRVRDGELIRTLPSPQIAPHQITISPTGQWVALVGKGPDGKGSISIIDTTTGKETAVASGEWQAISAYFNPSGSGELTFKRGARGIIYPTAQQLSDLPVIKWSFLSGQMHEVRVEALDEEQKIHLLIGKGFSAGSTLSAWCCTRGDKKIEITDKASGNKRELKDSFFRGGDVSGLAFVGGERLLAVGVTDGSIRFLETENGKTLLTLYGLKGDAGGNDWLAVTPDGLFDGTPGGWDALLWRFSDELYDVAPGEAFFNEFYRPGLLAEIMAGIRPKAPRNLAEVDRRQVQVALRVAGGTGRLVRVRVEVKEAPPGGGRNSGSGVRDVRLFRNGSLVKLWAGEVAGGAGVLEASIPIVAGENRFTAYAFNRDNIKSADARAAVTGADSLRRPATAWVLAFGINHYANRAFDLNFSVADAQAFAEQIGQGQTQLGRYQKVNLVSLKDAEVTKANLLSALRRLSGKDSGPVPKGAPKALAELKPAQPEDAVFIFFAGHGLAEGPRFYLVPHDLGYMGDPEQFDEKARATVFRHAVSDQELEAALETLDAERLVLAIDACHSGQALEAEERRRGPMNSKGLAQLAYEKGMYVITAAQSHQAALEFGQLGHGLLTYALVKEGLAQGQADRQPQDGRIEVREWLDYASARVPQLQMEAMRASAQRGRNVAVIRGEEKVADFLQRTLQQPRVFYRREPERSPFVIGGGR